MIRKTYFNHPAPPPSFKAVALRTRLSSNKENFSWNLLQKFSEKVFLRPPQAYKTQGRNFFRSTMVVDIESYNPLLALYPLASEAEQHRLCVSLTFNLRRQLDAVDNTLNARAENLDFHQEGYDKLIKAQPFYEIDTNQRVLLKGFILTIQVGWFSMKNGKIPDRKAEIDNLAVDIIHHQTALKTSLKNLHFFEDLPAGSVSKYGKRDAKNLSTADFFLEIFKAFRQDIFQGFQVYEEVVINGGRRFYGYIPALQILPFLHEMDLSSDDIRKNLMHFTTMHIHHSFIDFCRLVFSDHPLANQILGPIAVYPGTKPAPNGGKCLEGFLIAMEFQKEAGPKGSDAAAHQAHKIVDALLQGLPAFVKKYNLPIEY